MPPVTTRRQAREDADFAHCVLTPVKRKIAVKREKEQKNARKKAMDKRRDPNPLEAHFGAVHIAGVKKFQDILDKTCLRITELADKMSPFIGNSKISDKIQGDIEAFIGKTRLLVTSKLKKQYGKMLKDALDPAYTPPTSVEDLTGFWEMVQLQISIADEDYKRLETLHTNNWVEEVIETVNQDNILKPKVAKVNKNVKPVMSEKAAVAAKARAEKMKAFKAQMLANKKANADSGKENVSVV